MFGFLKEKLKQAAQIFSKKVEDEGEKFKVEEALQIEEKLGVKEKIKEKRAQKEKPLTKKDKKRKEVVEVKKGEHTDELSDKELERSDAEGLEASAFEKEERKEEVQTFEEESALEEELPGKESGDVEEQLPDKKGWFARLREKVTEKVTTTKIDARQFEDFFQELEYALLENNVAAEVIEKIKVDLRGQFVDTPLKKGKVEQLIVEALSESIQDVLQESDFDLLKNIKEKQEKPYVILFLGINGSGKTTTIAKIAHYLKQNKVSCVLAAGDTFRAASIEQLEEHGSRLGVKVIKQKYGADPAAVVFDAIAHAKARRIDCVLVDTAGRQHSNQDLMQEMKKIARVAKPDLKLFVGEAITGNDCCEQVREFDKAVEIDGIVLSKLDVDEKGGAAMSVSYVSGKPILFVGVGQKYGDLERFSKEKIVKNLGIEA